MAVATFNFSSILNKCNHFILLILLLFFYLLPQKVEAAIVVGTLEGEYWFSNQKRYRVFENNKGEILLSGSKNSALIPDEMRLDWIAPDFLTSSFHYESNFGDILLIPLGDGRYLVRRINAPLDMTGFSETDEVTYMYVGEFDGVSGDDLLFQLGSEGPVLLITQQPVTTVINHIQVVVNDGVNGLDDYQEIQLKLSNGMGIEDVNNDGIDDLVFPNNYLWKGTANEVELDGTYYGTKDGSFTASQRYDHESHKVIGGEITLAVGASASTVGVESQTGQAKFTMNLITPKGFAGVAPKLSISYNGSKAVGYLGEGMQINGIEQSIARCAKQRYVDGYTGKIDVSSYDNFCLNGQRIIAIDGSGRLFKTANDSYSKISSVGGTPAEPDYFKVEYISGEYAIFGSSDSAVLKNSDGVPLRWSLYKFSDPNENYYEVNYDKIVKGDGAYEYRVSEIKLWSENADTAKVVASKIEFNYSPLSNTGVNVRAREYWQGIQYAKDDQLASVVSYVGGKEFRSYEFKYRYGYSKTNKFKLLSITECGLAGESCFIPTTLDWHVINTEKIGIDFDNSKLSSGVCGNSEFGAGCSSKSIRYTDFNGDGYLDICYRTDAGIRCQFNDGNNQFNSLNDGDFVQTPLCAKDSTAYGGCDNENNYNTIAFQDFNLDGLSDIGVRTDAGVRIYYSKGDSIDLDNPTITSFCNNQTCEDQDLSGARGPDPDRQYRSSVQFPDINGDQLPDICWRSHNGIECSRTISYNQGRPEYGSSSVVRPNGQDALCAKESSKYGVCNSSDNYDTISYADFNADGLMDIAVRVDSGVRVFNSNGSNFEEYIQSTLCGSKKNSCNDENNYKLISYPDINGDGLTDVCFRSDIGIQCAHNTGAQSFSEPSGFGGCGDAECDNSKGDDGDAVNDPEDPTWHQSIIQFSDLNSDGKDDVFFRIKSGNLKAFVSEQVNAQPAFNSNYCMSNNFPCRDDDDYLTISYIDLDGDGDVELIYRNSAGIHVHENKMDVSPYTGRLKSVTNGFGLKSSFTYLPLRDERSVYKDIYQVTDRDELKYPYVTMPKNRSIYVVQSISTSDGQAGLNHTWYEYRNMVYDSLNQVDHGFTNVIRYSHYDPSSSIYSLKSNSTYSLHPRLKGVVEKEEVSGLTSSGNVKLLESTESRWVVNEFSGDNRVQAPYLAYSTHKKFDITSNGQHVYLGRTDVNNYVNGLADNSTASTYTANNYGGVTKVVTDILDEQGVKILRTEATTDYKHISDSNIYRVNLPENTVAKKTLYRTPNNLVSEKTSAWTYYDSGQLESEIIEPNNEQLESQKTYVYNKWGLRETETLSGVHSKTTSTTKFYDKYGQNVVEEINALNQTSRIEYHEVLRAPTVATDVNGLSTTITYDGFGRVESNKNNQTGVVSYTAYYKSGWNEPPYPLGPGFSVYYKAEWTNLGGYKETYYSDNGLVLKTSTTSQFGKVISQNFEYFKDGSVRRTSQPYFNGDSENLLWGTVVSRDSRNRVTEFKDANNATTIKSYSGLSTFRTNSLGITTTLKNNLLDQLVESNDGTSANEGSGNTVSYEYDVAGHRTSIVDNQTGHKTYSEYDLLGRRVLSVDPQKGRWTYTYNAVGQLILQTNANNQSSCFVYDALGRAVKRVDLYTGVLGADLTENAYADCTFDSESNPNLNLVTVWSYDTAVKGNSGSNLHGALHTVSSKDYRKEHFYDVLGRISHTLTTIKDRTYEDRFYYDRYSRLVSRKYDSGQQIYNKYNSQGALAVIKDFDTEKVYWEATAGDAHGNTTHYSYGNGVNTTLQYNRADGMISSSLSQLNGQILQNWVYSFDSLGNLDWREDHTLRLREDYTYDEYNRLENYSVEALESLGVSLHSSAITYHANGNIHTKTGTGSYNYTNSNCSDGLKGGSLHAVGSTTLNGVDTFYCYDANGNMVKRGNVDIHYSFADKPLFISEGSNKSIQFAYDDGQARMYRKDTSEGISTETYYLDGYQEIVKKDQSNNLISIKQKHYIGGVAVLTSTTGSNTLEEHYFHKDHLGSTIAISDSEGNLIEQFAYDPWGKKRNLNWNVYTGIDLSAFESSITNFGYGGHEQIDAFGLIHMGGRLYDAHLARFLGADPFIQAPKNYQSLNRYSYVMNNPLSLTDPSGYLWNYLKGRGDQFRNWVDSGVDRFADYLRERAAADKRMTQAFMTVGCAAAAAAAQGPWGCTAFTAISTTVLTKDLRQGAKAGAIAHANAMFWGQVGEMAGSIGGDTFTASAMRVGLHVGAAYVNARAHQLMGGDANIKDAMIAAAVSKSLYEAGVTVDSFYEDSSTTEVGFVRMSLNAIEAGIIGGYTAQQWGNGDWQTGAYTAAFARLFNDLGYHTKKFEGERGPISVEYAGSGDFERPVAFTRGDAKVILLPVKEGELLIRDIKLIDDLLVVSSYLNEPVYIKSTYRSDSTGQHGVGVAADIWVESYSTNRNNTVWLRKQIHQLGLFNRVASYPVRNTVHVDYKPSGNQGEFHFYHMYKDKKLNNWISIGNL